MIVAILNSLSHVGFIFGVGSLFLRCNNDICNLLSNYFVFHTICYIQQVTIILAHLRLAFLHVITKQVILRKGLLKPPSNLETTIKLSILK